jgi:hypothetical protein
MLLTHFGKEIPLINKPQYTDEILNVTDQTSIRVLCGPVVIRQGCIVAQSGDHFPVVTERQEFPWVEVVLIVPLVVYHEAVVGSPGFGSLASSTIATRIEVAGNSASLNSLI